MGDAADPRATNDDVIVAVLPVLGVEPTHVAEARRALSAQGRDVGDAGATRLLWVARALPAVLDVLADARNPVPLGEARLTGGVVVELRGLLAERAPLVAIARIEGSAVIVEVHEKRALVAAAAALGGGSGDDLVPGCTVKFPLSATGADEEVSVRRFRMTQAVGPA